VVQQQANPGKPEENRNKVLQLASEAPQQGADILLGNHRRPGFF
jgi:predicted amidohydrolase